VDEQQLPVLNAEADVVPGSVGATTDDERCLHLRSYALEPQHEVEVAFAFGHRTVGVVNLLSGQLLGGLRFEEFGPKGPRAYGSGSCSLEGLGPTV
jgi:hypothetical protein